MPPVAGRRVENPLDRHRGHRVRKGSDSRRTLDRQVRPTRDESAPIHRVDPVARHWVAPLPGRLGSARSRAASTAPDSVELARALHCVAMAATTGLCGPQRKVAAWPIRRTSESDACADPRWSITSLIIMEENDTGRPRAPEIRVRRVMGLAAAVGHFCALRRRFAQCSGRGLHALRRAGLLLRLDEPALQSDPKRSSDLETPAAPVPGTGTKPPAGR